MGSKSGLGVLLLGRSDQFQIPTSLELGDPAPRLLSNRNFGPE